MKYRYDLIQNWFEKRNLHLDLFPKQGIIISNWNKVPKVMHDYLSEEHELYFDDDGYSCGGCYKWVHRDDDKMLFEDGSMLCRECVEKDTGPAYEDRIFNAEDKPYRYKALPRWLKIPADFDLFDCGMENGLYAGMNDTPEKAVKIAKEQLGTNWDGIFKVDSSNPFMLEFSLYIRKRK